MSLNIDLLFLLNVYFFDNIIFAFDRISVFNEINDVLFLFLYSFLINKSLIFYKDDLKKNFFASNNKNLYNSYTLFFYKQISNSIFFFKKLINVFKTTVL